MVRSSRYNTRPTEVGVEWTVTFPPIPVFSKTIKECSFLLQKSVQNAPFSEFLAKISFFYRPLPHQFKNTATTAVTGCKEDFNKKF